MSTVHLTLAAGDGDPTTGTTELTVFSAGQRALRAGGLLAAALVGAAAIIPVPIIHLVGIPLLVVLGVVLAVRQLRAVARLAPCTLPCPKCGERTTVGGGLGMRSATGPLSLSCQSCRRGLTLSWS
ncbi:MAG TPA: hypothetical protein VFN90_02975 [Gemmatimonadales bacterium]|nr:hypothetical protein [Gemmatimonadales bacterium]